MRYYLEAKEIIQDEGTTPDFIRSDVTGMTDAEIQTVKDAMQDVMAGKTYELKLHMCGHDEDGACTYEMVD